MYRVLGTAFGKLGFADVWTSQNQCHIISVFLVMMKGKTFIITKKGNWVLYISLL